MVLPKPHVEFMESWHPRSTRRQAFSLVEVTIALGIVSFTIIPLFGLLAVGLNSNRGNIDRAINAQILNWVQGDVRSQTTSYSAEFDEFGVISTDPTTSYQASISPKPISLPGGSLSVPAWDVVITHQARDSEKIEERVVWGSP